MGEGIKIEVKVNQISETASKGIARDHNVVMDRPETKGGANLGPMGGENLLMSLGGCFMSNLLAAAAARENSINDVSLRIVGELGNQPARFKRIEMVVDTQLDDLKLAEKLITIAERGCIVANTLKQGLDIQINLV